MVRLFIACLTLILIIGCTLPSEDISSRRVFTQKQIEDAVTGQIRSPYLAITMQDYRYLGYSQDELSDFLVRFEGLQDIRYEPEYRDCDEFADMVRGNVRFFMKGIPFGTATTMDHKANIFVDESLVVKIIDIKRAGNAMLDVDPSVVFFKVEI